jgi:3-methyladenine DNA glycosylase AlkD
MTDATVSSVLDTLRALEDPRMREVNERHGDDHGVNLTKLRAVAKEIKTNHPFALELWATDDTPAQLVALLIARPKLFSAEELDTMLRQARARKTQDWLVNYIVKKSPHFEELRLRWLGDADPVVDAAGWSLTWEDVAKRPDLVDLDALLDQIDAEMKDAHERPQWEMNQCLAMIGIHHPSQRARALEIGERLEVLKDYPTPPNCTSPFAPSWINEIVRRQTGA